jgi:cytochrome P450
MTDFASVNFYVDESIVEDPYPYFEWIREQGNVWRAPYENVVAVVGYDEIWEVNRHPEIYSSVNAGAGPFGLPFTPEGDDIRDQIARHRDELPDRDQLVSYDPPEHTAHRALMMRLLTPKRMKENEDFIWSLADRQIDEFLSDGRCEFVGQFSQPFAMLVIADLLGVPESDHRQFVNVLAFQHPGAIAAAASQENPLDGGLHFLDSYFTKYVEDRRREPQDDVLTALAMATFPDGELAPVPAVINAAQFLFGAGQETTARLLATALVYLAEDPSLQDRLRRDPDRIPDFVEEMLRLDGPIKAMHRLVTTTTTLSGVELKAGTVVAMLIGAANRDPRHFPHPYQVDIDRPNVREHMAFGRGIHSCVGGSLARVELKISLARILQRMGDIRPSEEHHGTAGERHFNWAPTWMLRGLIDLNLEFSPL